MASAVGETISKLKEYIDIKTEQVKLAVLAKVTSILSSIISLSVVALFTFFLAFFLSFAFANLLNDFFSSSHIGYFIISGFYLFLIILILILTRRGIIKGWIESLLLNNTEEDDEPED